MQARPSIEKQFGLSVPILTVCLRVVILLQPEIVQDEQAWCRVVVDQSLDRAQALKVHGDVSDGVPGGVPVIPLVDGAHAPAFVHEGVNADGVALAAPRRVVHCHDYDAGALRGFLSGLVSRVNKSVGRSVASSGLLFFV